MDANTGDDAGRVLPAAGEAMMTWEEIASTAYAGDIDTAVAAARRLPNRNLKTLAAELHAGGDGADLLANVECRLRELTPDARAARAADQIAAEKLAVAENLVRAVWAGNYSPHAVVPTMERFGLTYQQYATEFGQGPDASERLKSALTEFTVAECREAIAALDAGRPSHKRLLDKAAKVLSEKI